MITGFLLTFVISLAFGVLGYFTGHNFIEWAGIAFISQFVVFFIVNMVTKTIMQMQLNKLEVSRLNAIDENRVRIKCAVCGEYNDVVIRVGQENEFRCVKCNSLNSISVNIENYQKTEIPTTNGILTEDIIKKLEEESKVE
jgi:transcription elongation factor Elf1